MKMWQVISSSIARIGYDFDQKILRVDFHNGTSYDYHDVCPEEVIHFCEGESLGAYFNHHIRGHYPYDKVA